MEEFDRPSIAAAQAYVLLSTYKLAYGGSRQAFLYLGVFTHCPPLILSLTFPQALPSTCSKCFDSSTSTQRSTP